MITRFKRILRHRVKSFLGFDAEIERLERRLSDLEESHYHAIGELRPPHNMIFVGDGDFTKIGEGFLKHFRDLCGLQSSERVLDVGCGIGRIAVALTKFLDETGHYEGFDIVEQGISWCKKNLQARFPHFSFQFVDVYNEKYNPGGKILAKQFRFPYGDASFDFVFAISVFTHMLLEDMENYLSEIRRVMASGARCFITYHLLNDESLNGIKRGKSASSFRHKLGPHVRTNDKGVPETGVAYDEQLVRSLYAENGLHIRGIHYGSWPGRENAFGFQDIVVASTHADRVKQRA